MRDLRIWVAVGLSAAALGASATGADASTFTNITPITVPACAAGDCSAGGRADPYPATISVDGLPATVATVRVTLRAITHSTPDDIDALLVGPGGQKELLMSDACAGTPLTGQSFFFDDSGPLLPASGPCVNGTYRPTNYGTPDNFFAPAPSPPYNESLSEYAGAPSNGLWQLFVMDDNPAGGVGTIGGGWRLELLPRVSCAGKPATVAADVGTAGDDVLTGTPGPNVMIGLGGNDTIKGLGGNDVICGGEGNDKLFGGPGKDLLRGQAGRDKLKGQGGEDTCVGGAKPDTARSCEKQKSI
jgi:hypothetical protein